MNCTPSPAQNYNFYGQTNNYQSNNNKPFSKFSSKMPATQRKRSLQLFRKLRFVNGPGMAAASGGIVNGMGMPIPNTNEGVQLDIDKMMLHALDCLGALQCVMGNYDSARARVFWGAVLTISEIGFDTLRGQPDLRHPGAIHLLRAFPNDAKATDGRGWLPLHWAAVSDTSQVEDVREIARAEPLAIVKGCNQPISANPGHLIAAVRRPNMDIVRCLYNFHPRMASSKDNDGDLPLHYAARYTDSVEMIEFLVQANPAATKVQNAYKQVPLFGAILHENEEIRLTMLKCLLKTDVAAAKMVNSDGDTALHLAVDQGCSPVCLSMLIEANPLAAKTQNDIGMLPLHLACLTTNMDVPSLELLLRVNPESVLVESAAGKLPAHYSAEYSTAPFFDVIVRTNPEALYRTCAEESDNAPIHFAVIGRNGDCVTHICNAYPDAVRAVNARGKTALHFAAEAECYRIYPLIHEAFPEAIRMKDAEGRLPLHLFMQEHEDAIEENSKEALCLRFLLKHYPEAVREPDSLGDTPIALCSPENHWARRMLLNCDPAQGVEEMRALNYESRRDAIFLAYAAINGDGIPNIFCQVRMTDVNLLRSIVSYL